MSELYSIRVAARPDDHTVELDIKVVHPDAMHIPDSPGFALMLLHDRAEGDAPLARELDLETVMNAEWAIANAKAFIASVELLSTKNEPPEEARDDYEHRYWKNPKKWLEGRLRIRATHPAWVSHVPNSWDSAAFDPAPSEPECDYEPCTPASPDDQPIIVVESEVEQSEGFLPAPRLLIASEVSADCPELIWIPRHGARAYEPHDRREGDELTIDTLSEWIGRPVIWRESDQTAVGVLAGFENGSMKLVSISGGSRSTRTSDPESLSWIGLAAFRRGTPRLAPPLALERLLDYANPAATVERVDDCEATIHIHVLQRDPSMQPQFNAADVLRLIAVPARASWGDFESSTVPLGRTLRREMANRDLSWDTQIYPVVANGFIESFEAEAPERPREKDLDKTPRTWALEFIEQRRWPCWTVRVVVTDPAWLEHLIDAGPWSFDFEELEPLEDWDDEPITWDPDLAGDDDDSDDEDSDGSDDSDDEDAPQRSTLRRHFELPGPVTKFAPNPADPRAVLRDHGMWEDVNHPEARDNFEAACKNGNVEAVRAYVALGINIESHTDISGETPLIRAAEGNQPEVVRILAKAGVNLQGRDGGGDTATMTAVNWNTPAALRALLEVGADPDAPDNYQNFPLVKALEEDNQELIDILLEGKASVNAGAATQDSALQWCLREQNHDRLRELVAREGADVNQINAAGNTLLHLAVMNEDEEAVTILLEAGANVGQLNHSGWSAREIAEIIDASGIAAQLDEAGASLNASKALAFFQAVHQDDHEAVIAALDSGVSPDIRAHHGHTALMWALSEEKLELAELLHSRGADLNARDADGDNCLPYARTAELRRWVLERGVAAAYRDSKGVLRQPGVEAVLDEDDHELLALLLDARTNFSDLSDLSVCHSSLIWGDFEGRLEERAQTLRTLGAAGADLEARSDDGTSILMGYINRGHEPPALALIDMGVNLELTDKNHTTPLIKSCGDYSNHETQARITRVLLAHGADYTKVDWLGRSAWESAESSSNSECMAAIEEVFEQTVRDALEECDHDEDEDPESFDAAVFEALARRCSFELLYYWIRKGRHALVRGVLKAGFNPNPPPLNEHGLRPGDLPLTLAISAHDTEMIRILLEGGANPNLVQMYGSTAMSYAVGERAGEVVPMLLAAGAHPMPTDDSGHTPMGGAAAHGNLEVLEMLVAAGASAQPHASGPCPLHSAVRNGQFETTQWLLAHGADIDARQEGRETALHVAIEKDEVELALALIAAGADPDVQTSDEKRVTPLILATKKGDVELITALLAAGADPHTKDADGESALDLASYRDELRPLFPEAGEAPRFERVERELPPLLRAVHLDDRSDFDNALDEGDVDVTNYRGDTALMLATGQGRHHMVEALLEAGAELKAKNAVGDTAWTYAFISGQEQLRAVFEERGATKSDDPLEQMNALNQMASQAMRRDAAIEAIRAGDVGRVVKQIDKLEFDVDWLAPGMRPLRLAIERGDATMIQMLLAKGADPSLDAGNGQTLQELAEESGFGELFEV
jgi:ankyrin repeat protein